MISAERKAEAFGALRAAGFELPEVQELLAGPKGLRDEFAAAALAGGLCFHQEDGCGRDQAETAMIAYQVADAMMIERAK